MSFWLLENLFAGKHGGYDCKTFLVEFFLQINTCLS